MKSRMTLSLATLAALCYAPAAFAYIPELDTMLYGRIWNKSGAVDQLMTSGSLTWRLAKPDGSPLLLRADVAPMGDGSFSYSLAIPQQALSLGQTQEATVLPLPATPATQRILSVEFDGKPATILAPASASLSVLQAARGAAVRMDLAVSLPVTDTDADGIPDWWEDANGLDKQNAADALLDPDGDGITNRAEYLASLNPAQDSRHPHLRTTEILAHTDGSSLVALEATDTDSTASQLRYTLTEAPGNGGLVLRDGVAKSTLVAGSTFTQQDILDGCLIYEHVSGTAPATFTVTLADENAAHPVADGTVSVRLFQPFAEPATREEILRNAANAATNAVVGDFATAVTSQTVSTAKFQSPHFLLGGSRADTLTGGLTDDTLFGGNGDDILAGKTGADTFIFAADGADKIMDFKVSEKDKLDVSALLTGTSPNLRNHLRVSPAGADTLVEIIGNTASIRLVGTAISLRSLFDSGSLITGGPSLPPLVSLAAATPRAGENGPTAGRFVVSSSTPVAAALAVSLQITGSATNGTDYQLVGTTATIPAGASSVVVEILPYRDAVSELDETVQLALAPQPAYELDTASIASMIIDDLKPQVTLEALNPLAEVTTQSPGAFVLERSGIVNSSLLVRLTIGGNATNGVDYNRIDNFVNLAPQQTSGVISIVPKATASLQQGAENVILKIKPDVAYLVGTNAMAAVTLVPEQTSFEAWKQPNKPDQLLRYAFGMTQQITDPRMLPLPEIRDGRLQIRFRKAPAAADLSYKVECSPDLVNWSPSDAEMQDVSLLETISDPTTAVYRVNAPLNQSQVKYLRVRLEQTQP